MSEKCCMGYGWWPMGRLCPIGRIDAGEWKGRTIKCPQCGAGDIDTGDRYEALKKHFDKGDTDA